MNLENYGVQELNAGEIREVEGGCVPLGDKCLGAYIADVGEAIGSAWDSFWGGFSAGKR